MNSYEALKARITELEGALQFYGERGNYLSGDTYVNGMTRPIMQDLGKVARAALTPDAQTRQSLGQDHVNPGMDGKPGEKTDYSSDIPEGK